MDNDQVHLVVVDAAVRHPVDHLEEEVERGPKGHFFIERASVNSATRRAWVRAVQWSRTHPGRETVLGLHRCDASDVGDVQQPASPERSSPSVAHASPRRVQWGDPL